MHRPICSDQLPVKYRSSVGQASVRRRSGVGQALVRCRSGVGQASVRRRSSVGQVSAKYRFTYRPYQYVCICSDLVMEKYIVKLVTLV